MRKMLSLFAALLFLNACESQVPVVTPDIQAEIVQSIKDGSAVLDCGFSCSNTWIFSNQDALTLLAQQDWVGLGTKIVQIGYQQDITYFYLGRAAEGLGAYEPALKYYRIAGALSTQPDPTLRCSGISDCQGFNFPDDIYTRITAVQADINKQNAQAAATSTYVKPKIHHTNKPAPVASSGDWITPPPITH